MLDCLKRITVLYVNLAIRIRMHKCSEMKCEMSEQGLAMVLVGGAEFAFN